MANNVQMNKSAIVRVLLLSSLLIISGLATAESPPSDNELKAAYCLKITQWRLVNSEKFVATGAEFKALHDKEVLHEKLLRGYLFSRLGVLDANALIFAAHRADEDMESNRKIPICQQIAQEPNKSL